MTLETTFPLGDIVSTQTALDSLSMADIDAALQRHALRDWGDLDDRDRQANEDALVLSDRILSSYKGSNGTAFWIITEWDRSYTTVLLPSDY